MADTRNDGLSIFNIVVDRKNGGVLVCSVLTSIEVGYTCVYPEFGLEAGGY